MSKAIPYGKQHLDEEDIQSVIDVLKSNFLTTGPKVKEFEDALCNYTGAKYAVAVSNGTAALHLGALTLGANSGSKLWTSPLSFVASANCGLYCGSQIDFVDINLETLNIDISLLEKKIISEGPPDILVPVHFAGLSCKMEPMYNLAKKYGFKIMEDAAHAFGGNYNGKKVGNCEYSDLTVSSFHPVKSITSGEGGVVFTNNKGLYEHLLLMRTHGITRDPKNFKDKNNKNRWYYEQQGLGYNYRLSDIHCALGITQLKKTDKFIEKRVRLAERYQEKLKDLPLTCQEFSKDSGHHIFPIKLNNAQKQNKVFNYLYENNILVNLHYIPIHLQPIYQELGFKHGQFPNAEAYYSGAITLPLYYDLSYEEQDRVIHCLKSAVE